MFEFEPVKRSSPKHKAGKTKTLAWIGTGGVVLLIAGFLIWKHHVRHYIPPTALKDIQAARQAKHSAHRFERFLDLRYGPQTNPANRVKAIEDLLNVDQIEELYLVVNSRTNSRIQARIAKVARTIAKYRQTMSPEEKAQMGAYFQSDAGRAQIRKATDFYQSKDARFRSLTAPVISQLLTTITVTEQAQPPPSP